MSPVDYTVIVLYFALVIGIGFWYQRRASKSLKSYFLAAGSMHWLALAMSGSVATFDITGTMWIVALIYLFGMKSMWNHWMWGFLMAAFFMSYMGKWVRRSGVMTGAEWMVTRFGDGRDGRTARMSYTLMAVVMLTGFIGYAFQGIGKFAAVYVDLGPLGAFAVEHEAQICAVTVFAITTLYVLLGGLYSVVITNVIQTIILTVASIVIAAVAYTHLTAPDPLLIESASGSSEPRGKAVMRLTLSDETIIEGEIATAEASFLELRSVSDGTATIVPTRRIERIEVTAVEPADGTPMTSLAPQWHLDAELPADYAGYEWFGALVLIWVVKGLLLNFGGPGQMTDFQIFLATRSPRDASKLGAAWSGFLVVRWAMCMGIAMLAIVYGLEIINEQGKVDPESVMPMVLQRFLDPGVLGLVIAGLLAAFMSTFSATVNAAASYIVRDLWQPLVRPGAGEKHLIRASYLATVSVVLVGTVIGFYAESIRQIWDWLMLALGAAFLFPNVMRWYWWRLNGWGYAAGTLAGLAGALPLLVLSLMGTSFPLYVTFPAVCAISLVATLAGTLLTQPTDEAILVSFLKTVRPFGVWGPIRRQAQLTPEQLADRSESLSLAMVNLVLASVVILGGYLSPMYLVGHWHWRALGWFAAAVAAAVILYFTWYRNLSPADAEDVPGR